MTLAEEDILELKAENVPLVYISLTEAELVDLALGRELQLATEANYHGHKVVVLITKKDQ
jgi:hypothetical protein